MKRSLCRLFEQAISKYCPFFFMPPAIQALRKSGVDELAKLTSSDSAAEAETAFDRLIENCKLFPKELHRLSIDNMKEVTSLREAPESEGSSTAI